MTRHTIPDRCNKPSTHYSPSNGYRVCLDCKALESKDVVWGVGTFGSGRCDRPTDDLGAARYVKQGRV